MTFKLKFEESDQRLKLKFVEAQTASDGGFERGYAAGYEDGEVKGYSDGEKEGYTRGQIDGYAECEADKSLMEDELLAKTIAEYHNPRPVTIGNRFFSYCYNLVLVDLPNAVTIGDYAFVYCTALKELSLPSVTNIAAFAFQNCTALTTVDLGVVRALQSNVFTNTNIRKLILRKHDAITTNGSTAVFNNTPMARGEGFIYVPDHLVEDYKAAQNWTAYAAQIKPLSELGGN